MALILPAGRAAPSAAALWWGAGPPRAGVRSPRAVNRPYEDDDISF